MQWKSKLPCTTTKTWCTQTNIKKRRRRRRRKPDKNPGKKETQVFPCSNNKYLNACSGSCKWGEGKFKSHLGSRSCRCSLGAGWEESRRILTSWDMGVNHHMHSRNNSFPFYLENLVSNSQLISPQKLSLAALLPTPPCGHCPIVPQLLSIINFPKHCWT